MLTYEWTNPETGEIVTRVGVFIRTPFNYDMGEVSEAGGLDCSVEPSKTQQQFKEECDINTIVERFGLTGELPTDVRMPVSGDYVDAVSDYHSAMNIVRAAEEAFMKFPADVRARFNNDPQRLQEFVEDKSNLDEARKLGLAVPAPVPAPVPPPMDVRIVADPTKA